MGRIACVLVLALCATLAARASESLALDIPAGPLWTGLQQLARVSGQRVLVPEGSSRLSGHTHPSVEGSMQLEEALERMLHGSGFGWERDARGSIVVSALRAAQATLDPLQIEAHTMDELSPSAPGSWARTDGDDAGVVASSLQGPRLDAMPPRAFDDLLRRAPNVSGQGEGLSIRGIERGSSIVATSSIYLDGIPLGTRLLADAALPSLQRVDYLRGPRAIRDGAGALAGVLRLETPEPLAGQAPVLRASLGARERELRLRDSGQVGVSGPTLGGEIVLQSDRGNIDNPVTHERGIDRNEQALLQGRLLYEPEYIESLTLRASALLLRADPGLSGLVPPVSTDVPFDPFDRQSFDPLPRTRRIAGEGAAIELEWQPHERTRLLAFAQAAHSLLDDEIQLGGAFPERQRREDIESVRELGLRWEQDLHQGWRARFGIDQATRRSRLSDTVFSPLQAFFPEGLPITVTPQTERRVAVAAHNEVDAGGALAELEWNGARFGAGLGLRQVRERRRAVRVLSSTLSRDDCRIRIGSGAEIDCIQEFPPIATRQRTPSDDDVTVPHLRAHWQPSAGHRLGLEVRRGHVGGGARLDTASGVLAPYRPERSDTLDLGWNARFLDGRLQLDTTVFYNRWIDRHVPLDLPQRENFVILNAGRARAYGAEFELQWQPDESLLAWFGVGLLNTRYDAFEARSPDEVIDLAGRRFPGAAPVTATLGGKWQFAPDWSLGLSQWYSAAVFSDPLNTQSGRREAYSVLDLLLRHQWTPSLQIDLAISNALDERYLADVRVAGATPRPREYTLGQRREVSLALEWRW